MFENEYIARYGGAAGFILKKTNGEETSYSDPIKLVEAIIHSLKTNDEGEIIFLQETSF